MKMTNEVEDFQSLLDILDAEARTLEFHYSMWDCVNRGDFVDAMTQQFYFFFWSDLFDEKMKALSDEDRELYESLFSIATGGK